MTYSKDHKKPQKEWISPPFKYSHRVWFATLIGCTTALGVMLSVDLNRPSRAFSLLNFLLPGLTKEAQRARSGERYYEPNPTYPPSGSGIPPGAHNAFSWQGEGWYINASGECLQNEYRDVYWSPGSYPKQERRVVPCGEGNLRAANEQLRQAYEKRKESCGRKMREDYWSELGSYIDRLIQNSCPEIAKSGNYPDNHTQFVSTLKEMNRNEIAEDRRRAENKRQQDMANFNNALSMERRRAVSINNSGNQRHFYYLVGKDTDTPRVASFIIPIASLQGGRTLGGARVVDLNVRTFINGESTGEQRARIYCDEGKHMWLSGSAYAISGDVGRWACAKFNYYHPPRN